MQKVVIGDATLYLGDCMEAMQDMADNTFDLAIVDPPYGINAPVMSMGQNLNRADGWKREASTAVKLKGRLNSGGGKLKNRLLNKSDIGWDCEVPSKEYFNLLFRVSSNQIIWGGNYFDLRPSRCVLCWDKCQPWENFSQWEMAWTSFDKPAALFSHSNTGGANKEAKIHPTQKPVKLYGWVLSRYGMPGISVLDTHMGSGSSVIACLERGCSITAYEINPEYFDAACKRIESAQQQLKLVM
jgi:site-specific DNA-methyltransferase (adenine-specific)